MLLREAASELVVPKGIETTSFPWVAKRLAEMDYPLDDWQAGIGTLLLGKRANGLYAAGESAVVLSIPRQTGKTYTIAGIIFALCSLQSDLTVLWTAHHSRTHAETFSQMTAVANQPKISPFVSRVAKGNGKEAVVFANGSRILFGAREQGFGRGFAKVDFLILDEAQILPTFVLEDMTPATNAAPNGLVVLMGTPPRPKDPGEAFTSFREGALSGDDEDTLYIEFSAPKRSNIDSRETWRRANPSYPVRTTDAAIKRLRKLLITDEGFKREALGMWDEAVKAKLALDVEKWRTLAGSPPVDGVRCFGVKFTADGSHVGLAGAVRTETGVFVEAIKQAPMSDGTSWLVDFLSERMDATAAIVVDGRSGAGYLVNALRDAGVGKRVLVTPTTQDVTTAHAMFEQAVTESTLTHGGGEELTRQVSFTVRRPIGKGGGFGWASSVEGETTALLDAVTFAYWGVKTTKRRPGRVQKFL